MLAWISLLAGALCWQQCDVCDVSITLRMVSIGFEAHHQLHTIIKWIVWSSTIFPQSDSLKLDSLVFKTKSLSFRTRVPLKPDSIIPKTPVNISVKAVWDLCDLTLSPPSVSNRQGSNYQQICAFAFDAPLSIGALVASNIHDTNACIHD